ncbi:MAG TPA: type II toxin-antitoxin system MqsA family antitoxin [Gemmataceae bacterium]|nr:type II toxin-antitoxin system MqsA family antitoxin [Gemmataceae bacterium]
MTAPDTQTGQDVLCPTCYRGHMHPRHVTERFPYEVDGETTMVVAENVPVDVCDNCGEQLSGPEAARIRHEAICRALKLLTPAEIRAIRERLNLTQAEFARLTRLGEATICRWERGRLLQNPAMDRYLRLMAASEENVRFLQKLQGPAPNKNGALDTPVGPDMEAAPPVNQLGVQPNGGHMNEVPSQLVEHQQELQQLDPLSAAAQAIEYRKSHWDRHVGADDADLNFLACHYAGAITRGHLAGLARTAQAQRDSTSIRRLFLGTMLWGYGTVGYGPHRTAKMLAATDALQVLHSTLDCVWKGDTRTAYERFHLPKCGPAFFTKFFYFAGLGCDLKVQPLILDSVVMNKLEQWLGLDVTPFGRFTRDKDRRISAIGRNAAGYERYVQLLNGWARELRCRADSIELFLFTRSAPANPAK